MRVSTAPRRKNAPRIAEKAAPGFLQWLRGRDCVWGGCGECSGKMEAAHLDFAGDKGMGTKVSDRFAVPMCANHHWLQHRYGWDTFLTSQHATKEMALNAAAKFWREWPQRLAWERKLDAQD
jgi:hypothetical protein